MRRTGKEIGEGCGTHRSATIVRNAVRTMETNQREFPGIGHLLGLLLTMCILQGALPMPLVPNRPNDRLGPDGRGIVRVPRHYRDLKEAITHVRNGDTVFIQKVGPNFRSEDQGERGWHYTRGRLWLNNPQLWREREEPWRSGCETLEELREHYRNLDKLSSQGWILEKTDCKANGWMCIRGDPGVKVHCQMVVYENVTGQVIGPMKFALFRDICVVFQQMQLTHVSAYKCCVTVHGPEWLMRDCEIRTSGGTALRTDWTANVKVHGCAVGGLLAYDVDGRLCKASSGINVLYNSTCEVLGSTVEHTEVHKTEHLGGHAVKVSNSGTLTVQDSVLHSHSGVVFYWSHVDDLNRLRINSGRIFVSNCVIRTPGISFFAVKGRHEKSQLHIQQTTLHGEDLWANEDRPSQVVMTDITSNTADTGIPCVPEYHMALFKYKPKNPRSDLVWDDPGAIVDEHLNPSKNHPIHDGAFDFSSDWELDANSEEVEEYQRRSKEIKLEPLHERLKQLKQQEGNPAEVGGNQKEDDLKVGEAERDVMLAMVKMQLGWSDEQLFMNTRL